MRKLLGTLLLSVLVASCVASGSARYSASVSTPRLVYVSSDVQVIEDYDQPVFYSSDMYWRYDGGVWYRSRYHNQGWVRVSVLPAAIVRIERPTAYIHYRASGRAAVTSEHREDQQEKREAKEERKEEREDRKEDRKEERREEHKDHPQQGNDDHGPGKNKK